MFKKLSAVLLCLTLICSALVFASCSGSDGYDENCTNTDYKLAENIEDGAILQCFCWDFETITSSLEDIAAAGYSAIQTSPINECLVGEEGGMDLYGDGKWYYHYQPTDFTIGNYQLGTREQFKKMCTKAHKLGIKVIVDIIANHTTPTKSEINQNLLDAVGGMDKLFHVHSTMDITDYGDRLQCTTYNMGGLPDIDTENKAFQDYFIKYINDCIDCGADGFRYDTAKHIGLPDDPTDKEGDVNNFWERVTTEIKNAGRIFNYGEVLQGSNDRIGDYIKAIGRTTASSYGEAVRSAVINGCIDTAFVEELKVSSGASCVTWVESHDNYINDGNWASMDNQQIILAWAIIDARGVGTPLFFDRPYGCSVDNQWGTMNRIGASGDYIYKDKTVRAVNFFRNAMAGEEEAMYNPDEEATSLQICRGDKGAVIVNLGGELEVNFETDLADGKYTDRVDNETVYTVKDGTITCDTPIPENTVVVLYNEGYTQFAAPATVKISDDVNCIYAEDTLKVELEAENAQKATYSINGTKAVEYKDGDTVTIKAEEGKDGVTTLTLRGTSKAGQKTYMKYYFTSTAQSFASTSAGAEKGDSVSFVKPDDWGEEIYAYIYNDDGTENSPWPGEKMESAGDGTYLYTLDADLESSYIIFSDGENQYPGQNEQGLPLEKDKEYTAQ